MKVESKMTFIVFRSVNREAIYRSYVTLFIFIVLKRGNSIDEGRRAEVLCVNVLNNNPEINAGHMKTSTRYADKTIIV